MRRSLVIILSVLAVFSVLGNGACVHSQEERETADTGSAELPVVGMPAHPDLVERLREGTKPVPGFISDPETLKRKGIDQPGMVEELAESGSEPTGYRSALRRYPSESREFVPGEVVVKFSEGTPAPQIELKDGIAVTGIPSVDVLNREFGVRSIERVYGDSYRIQQGLEEDVFGLTRVYRFVVPREADIPVMVARYEFDSHIESAQPKYFHSPEPDLVFLPGQFLVQFKIGAPAPMLGQEGEVAITGIPSIDDLNKKFSVRSIEKVFPEGGLQGDNEKEEQTIDLFGLLRLYKFSVAEQADVLSIIREYQLDPTVESATPSYKARK